MPKIEIKDLPVSQAIKDWVSRYSAYSKVVYDQGYYLISFKVRKDANIMSDDLARKYRTPKKMYLSAEEVMADIGQQVATDPMLANYPFGDLKSA